MAVVVLRRRAMLDAHELLEGRGFSGGSEGGFKIPEDITATKVDEDGEHNRYLNLFQATYILI